MSSTFPQRVAFEDHRFMRAIDLEDDQLYHLQRRWQHNLGLHSWGILCGLEVRINGPTQRQPDVVIYSGMALDGYGREIVVTDVLTLREEQPILDPSVTYDIWITYNVALEDSVSPDAECDSVDSDCCTCPPDMSLRRIVERPQIRVQETAARQSGSVTRPREVPLGDLDFSPERPMKFDALSPWPVFLCKIEYTGTTWKIDETERHYGGLIAERIEVPFQRLVNNEPRTRGTAILNGGHPERKDWRFAVLDVPTRNGERRDTNHTLPDDVPAPLSVRAITRFNGEQPTADTEIRWQAERVIAEADFELRGGAGLQFESNQVGEEPVAPTSGWGIYRQFRLPAPDMGTNKDGTPIRPDPNAAQFADVLQISMPNTDRGLNSVAIGAVDTAGKFVPILEIHNDESVDINGTLRVHGEIFGITTDLPPLNRDRNLRNLAQNKLPEALVDPAVTPAVKQLLVKAVADGIPPDDFAAGIVQSTTKAIIYQTLLPACVHDATPTAMDTAITNATNKAGIYQTLLPACVHDATPAAVDTAITNATNNVGIYQTLLPACVHDATPAAVDTAITNATNKAGIYQTLLPACVHDATPAAVDTAITNATNKAGIYQTLLPACVHDATPAAVDTAITNATNKVGIYQTLLPACVHDATPTAVDTAITNATNMVGIYDRLVASSVPVRTTTDAETEAYFEAIVAAKEATVTQAELIAFCRIMAKVAVSKLSGPNIASAIKANPPKWDDLLAHLWTNAVDLVAHVPANCDPFAIRLATDTTSRSRLLQAITNNPPP
ncbi:MAG: hypothetical protein WCJ09_22680 [Planctomycetota bacterium]